MYGNMFEYVSEKFQYFKCLNYRVATLIVALFVAVFIERQFEFTYYSVYSVRLGYIFMTFYVFFTPPWNRDLKTLK